MKTTFKKALCLLLTLCLISGTVFTLIAFADDATAPAEVAKGDVNGDGTIDTADVVKLRQYFANLDYSTGVSSTTIAGDADLNKNGSIDLNDLYLLRIMLAGGDIDENETDSVVTDTEIPDTDAPESSDTESITESETVTET